MCCLKTVKLVFISSDYIQPTFIIRHDSFCVWKHSQQIWDVCHFSVNQILSPQDLGCLVVLNPLQIEVCIHFGWFTPSESSMVYEITQNKATHRLWMLQSKQWNMPRNLFRSKEKLLAVDPEEAVSTRIGTVEYFIASTIFCWIEALMRNNWNQSLPAGDGGDTQWRVSLCLKPQRGFNSSLGEETETSLSSANVILSGLRGGLHTSEEEHYIQYFANCSISWKQILFSYLKVHYASFMGL